MSYLYETHMHTCQASACGVSTGKEHARFYKEMGYTGIIMTDHFFRGNSCIPRDLPWEERVDLFWRGYEDAWEEGQKIGLDVFFGLEENYNHDEYLIYGLKKDWMKEHPEMEHWTRTEQLREVHAAGGCVIEAHPFRIRNYMQRIQVGDLFCDGVEVANLGNNAIDDARAMAYARAKNLLMTAGSDNHHSPKETVFGVELEERLRSIDDYVALILRRGPIGLHVPEERFEMTEIPKDERYRAWWINEREEIVPLDFQGKEW